MAAPLPYSLINVKVIELEKVTRTDMQSLQTFWLTHWLPMTSILFLVETIQRKQFRCIYRKNQKLLLYFCVHFFKSISNFEHFQKRMTLRAYEFPKLWTPKNVVILTSKKSRLTWPIDRQPSKRAERVIQSQRQLLYHIRLSMWK